MFDGFVDVYRGEMRKSGLRRRFAVLYGVVIVLVAASFVWQMLHGICPVP